MKGALAAPMVAVAAGVLVAACGARAPVPVPPPRVQAAGGCEGCHQAIATEWRASFHRSAFTDESFQRSLALEDPKEHAFCTGCHAPAAARAGVAAGVDCESCHATPHRGREARSGGAACAPCHEFPFDGGRRELVQKTLSEHARSDYADVACASCHMPTRDGHKDHRFLSGHAPEKIAAAVRVTATREGASDALALAIHVDAGHAFPTGDMFRRARLVVCAEGPRGEIVADAERMFGRTFTALATGPHAGARTEAADTRITGSWREIVRLDPPAPIARVRYRLLYERVLAVRGGHVTALSSDVVAEGVVPW